MITAAFDTSVGLSLAVAENDDLLLSVCAESHSGRRANDMADWLWQNLNQVQLRPAEVTRWTVGTGPGSFVGLRCGMALIKGICTQSAAQVRGLPSSLAVALSLDSTHLSGSCSTIAVLNDARQGEVILTLYTLNENILTPVAEPEVKTPDELEPLADQAIVFVSIQADVIRARLPSAIQDRLVALDGPNLAEFIHPDGWPWPETTADMVASTEPVYVRPAVFVKPNGVSPTK